MHQRESFSTALEPPAGSGGQHGARASLGVADGALHRLDYADLALGAQGMGLVLRAALEVLRRFGAVDEAKLTLSRALALFLDHVMWEEKSGRLILCADFSGATIPGADSAVPSFCLTIPRGWWSLAARGGRAQ